MKVTTANERKVKYEIVIEQPNSSQLNYQCMYQYKKKCLVFEIIDGSSCFVQSDWLISWMLRMRKTEVMREIIE